MSKNNIMAKDILQCPDCRDRTQILIDHSQGLVLCRNCGLVLETSCIDDSQEWRSFSDSATDGKSDRNRVGGITNDMFPNQASGTTMAAGNSRLSRTQFLAMSDQSTDRTLSKAHSVLRDIMKALGLPDNIYGRCCETIKFMDDQGLLRNRTNSAWMLAVVYMSCRQEKAGRPIAELIRAAPTVKEAEVAKNYWRLDKLLAGTAVRSGTVPPADAGVDNSIVRYCSRLGLQAAERAAEHVAKQASRYGITGSRNPGVVAAAAIYMVSHLLNLSNKPSLESVSEVAQMKPATVKQVYLTLRQPAARLLPPNFKIALPEGLDGLP